MRAHRTVTDLCAYIYFIGHVKNCTKRCDVCLFLFCVTHTRAYQDILKEGLLKHKFAYPRIQKK